MKIKKAIIIGSILFYNLTNSFSQNNIKIYDSNHDGIIEQINTYDEERLVTKEFDNNRDFLYDTKIRKEICATYIEEIHKIEAKKISKENKYINISKLIKEYYAGSYLNNKIEVIKTDCNGNEIVDKFKIIDTRKSKKETLVELIDKNFDGKFDEGWILDPENSKIKYHLIIEDENIIIQTYKGNKLKLTHINKPTKKVYFNKPIETKFKYNYKIS